MEQNSRDKYMKIKYRVEEGFCIEMEMYMKESFMIEKLEAMGKLIIIMELFTKELL